MCSLVLLLTISFQLLASYNSCLPSLLAFTYFMPYVCSPFTFCVYRNHVEKFSGDFKNLARVGLAILRKIFIFIKFWNGSIKLFGITSEQSEVFYFLNNDAKTCLYGLNISGSIEIEHIFKSKAFFSSQWQSLHKLLQRLWEHLGHLYKNTSRWLLLSIRGFLLIRWTFSHEISEIIRTLIKKKIMS